MAHSGYAQEETPLPYQKEPILDYVPDTVTPGSVAECVVSADGSSSAQIAAAAKEGNIGIHVYSEPAGISYDGTIPASGSSVIPANVSTSTPTGTVNLYFQFSTGQVESTTTTVAD